MPITMNRKFLLAPTVAGILIVATLLSAGCITTTENPKPGEVRVGYLTGDLHHLAYFVAKNASINGGKSMFEKHNIKVTDALTGGYASGPVEMDNFGKGSIDIGFMGAPPAISKHVNADIKTKIVGVVNEIGSALVVKASIKNASDLKGKTILTPAPGSIQYFLLIKYLTDNGISRSELTITTNVGVPLMKDTMSAGKADGFISWEPFCEDAVTAGIGHILVYSKQIWPDHLCCVVVVSQDFASKNGSRVTDYLKAYIEAVRWINAALADNSSANYQKLVSIAVGFTQRSEATIKLALQNMKYDWQITSTVEGFITAFTQDLLAQGAITQANLQARGYANATELTSKYVDKHFLADATK
jgi:NitT/TauT family transport system substrate-binding protein